ncbi:MAG: ATP-binding protein [Thermodesulfobacteriota bacterium]|nr:ATP-binding protein [Thermodesulfobacteriota bacterium]
MLPTKTTPQKQNLADLTVLVYGRSKIGKSTWCSHSDGALFLATEPGLNALDVYQVPIRSWDALLAACGEIADGKHPFKTVIIDTIDNAYRMCSDYICTKFKIEHESDLGYGKGWALINNEFHRVLTKMAFMPYGLFLVSHSVEKEIETRTGKYTRIVPTLPDKARKIVVGMVDLILYCDLEAVTDEEGKTSYRRVMRTKPSPHYEAGDRTGRLPETIDLDFSKFTEVFNRPAAAPKAGASRPTSAPGDTRDKKPVPAGK